MIGIPVGQTSSFWESLSRNTTRYRLSRPFQQHPIVAGCCRRIADAIKGLQGSVYDPVKGEAVEHHWLNDLLTSPNNYQSQEQFLEATSLIWESTGGVFWMIEGANNELIQTPESEWRGLYPVGHKWFQPFLDTFGRLLYWDYNCGTTRRKVLPWQVIRFGYIDPENPYGFISPADSCGLELTADQNAAIFNCTVLENGGHPGVILQYPRPMLPEQKEQAAASFDAKFSGPDKAGRTYVQDLEGKAQVVGNTHADMQFLEGRRYSRDLILATFNVPPVIFGVTEDVSFATHEGQRKIFYETNIVPKANTIEGGIYRATGGKVWWRFDFTQFEFLRASMDETARTADIMIGHGVAPRVAYELQGKELPEDMPGLDDSYMKTSLVPIDMLGDTGPAFSDLQEDPEPEPEPKKDAKKSDGSEDDCYGAFGIITAAAKDKRRASIHRTMIASLFAPGERRVMRAYAQFLGRAKKQVLARIEELSVYDSKAMVRKFIDPDALNINDDEWVAELQKLLMPKLEQIGADTVKVIGGEFGSQIAFDVGDPAWGRFFQRKALKVKTIPGTLKSNIKAVIRKGIDDNLTVDEIAKAIRARFDVEKAIAMRIARTETGMTVNGVRDEVFRKEGVSKQIWSTASDEAVRQSHRVLGGLAAQLTPHDWGSHIGKSGLYYPCDMRGPAEEVINCRCVALAED